MRRRIALLAVASTFALMLMAPLAEASVFRRVSYCPVIRTAELRAILDRAVSARAHVASPRQKWDRTCVFTVAGLVSYTPQFESAPFYSNYDLHLDWNDSAPPGALAMALGDYRQGLWAFNRHHAATPGAYYRISFPRGLGHRALAVEENVLTPDSPGSDLEVLQRHVLVKKGSAILSVGIAMPPQRLGAPSPLPTMTQLQSIIRIAARRVR